MKNNNEFCFVHTSVIHELELHKYKYKEMSFNNLFPMFFMQCHRSPKKQIIVEIECYCINKYRINDCVYSVFLLVLIYDWIPTMNKCDV